MVPNYFDWSKTHVHLRHGSFVATNGEEYAPPDRVGFGGHNGPKNGPVVKIFKYIKMYYRH
jgi:hypothetical protein